MADKIGKGQPARDGAGKIIPRLFKDLRDDASAFGEVLGFPENEEIVALENEPDVTGGRTSADLVNKYGRGIFLLVKVTGANGGTDDGKGGLAVQCEFGIEMKVADGYAGFTYALVAISSESEFPRYFVFFFHPEIATSQYADGAVQTPVPRNYRVKTSSATDDQGNDISYSVTVVHLL
jgi:hypothetical protein